ncbi:TPA: hypothetical protein PC537_000046 [Morganella morganii]|nr:hypothetical protein [Morganella morganii]
MQNLMPPIDTTDHAFHDGDPTTGQLGTIVTAAWLNDVQGATRDIQAEIIAVLTKAGMQPNPQKQNQLAEAISQIIGSGGYATSGDLTLGLSKKIDKADIAQQLGNDTTKVPSLHLVATELGKKASIADANSKLAKDQNGADIPDKPKFIENLGLGELRTHFIVTDKESRMLSPNQKLAVLAHDNKTSGAWDDELQRMLWAFDDKGKMIHGIVPAERVSGLGTAASKNTGNLPGQVPDMSFFPESGKWTDNGLTTLPNGVMIQSFKRTIANDQRTGYPMTSYVPFPTAFPNGVWAVLCTKTTYAQIIVSCEGITKQGFNVVTVKAFDVPTTESTANFLVLGY